VAVGVLELGRRKPRPERERLLTRSAARIAAMDRRAAGVGEADGVVACTPVVVGLLGPVSCPWVRLPMPAQGVRHPILDSGSPGEGRSPPGRWQL
jgi:hypothetical protein